MKPDLVIFDLDGTLINSIGGIAYSSNHVIESHGFPTRTVEEYATFIGGGVKGTIAGALEGAAADENLIDEMVSAFKGYYSQNPLVNTGLYKGIPELLDFLEGMGVKVAVNTNKHALISYPIIEALLGPWQLTGYLAPDDRIPLKPDPTAALELAEAAGTIPGNCYYVGDSKVDLQTADNAGMKSILVDWGYGQVSDQMRMKADYIAETPKALIRFFENLFVTPNGI